ncbi:hypothetical protein SRS16P2_00468 (plasmid) [Variovorax sp. SRS16]|uniref:hypothetical protein n=1 Tax=Variovorax sp. SRS16 TaxID=282217 RepID=UPI0013175C80|nr:hypothetical protein [Variovorax sp. SRS16]VTU46069.1 hypothetical protein SRS16P2_00468 [Variovorax sp. SRS16]
METDGEVDRFDYEGWQVLIRLTKRGEDGFCAGCADLHLKSEHRCRIALASKFSNDDEAIESLRLRSLAFIVQWDAREHTGDTDFTEL